jgi:hypothetical protein
MYVSRLVVRGAGAGLMVAVVVGAMPATSSGEPSLAQLASQPSAHIGSAHLGARLSGAVETSATGNRVELVDPAKSTYVPRVRSAPLQQRTRARRLLRRVNEFCHTHTLAGLRGEWRPGELRESEPTHYFDPDGESGVDPAHPRAALVSDGKVDGVMFSGRPLPRLGVIPRAHRHAEGAGMGSDSAVEMVHVYCTDDLTLKSVREAFTPSRQLGVLADTIRLRQRIRPAIVGLDRRQLREVRTRVRRFLGDQVPAGSGTGVEAMRSEIREALMELNEEQLRSIRRLMRSY